MTRLVLIADDLTGALDSAAPFATRRYRTAISFSDNDAPIGADVRVYSTESRNLPSEEAAARIRRIAGMRTVREAELIYKKIDSTLRGPIAAELSTLIRLLKIERALICPAFPDQGRTVVGGRLLVDGVPLAETIFGREVTSDSLLELLAAVGHGPRGRYLPLDTLRHQPNAVCQHLAARGLVVVDAEYDEDLRSLASHALDAGVRLLVGSAGLAAGLAESLPERRQSEPERSRKRLPDPEGGVLVVAGSLHPRTAAQIDALRHEKQPVPILTAPPLDLEYPRRPEEVAGELAGAALRAIEAGHFAGLVVTGGDIAWAVCSRLRVHHLELVDQVEPGMPVSQIAGGVADGLRLVTKAGGFGDERALLRAVGYLMA